MAKKKKLTKAERKEARLRKGKQWLLTYTGSTKKMNKHYRERFHVDAVTAAKDLQEDYYGCNNLYHQHWKYRAVCQAAGAENRTSGIFHCRSEETGLCRG